MSSNPSLPGIFLRPWQPGSGSQGFIPHFLSFVNFSSLGKRVGVYANGYSAEPRVALGPILGYQGTFFVFSGILQCFDSTYRLTLPKNPKMCRFGRSQLGWGYGMVPWWWGMTMCWRLAHVDRLRWFRLRIFKNWLREFLQSWKRCCNPESRTFRVS